MLNLLIAICAYIAMSGVCSYIASYLAYRPQVRLDDLQEIRQLVELVLYELATAGQEDRQSSRTSA